MLGHKSVACLSRGAADFENASGRKEGATAMLGKIFSSAQDRNAVECSVKRHRALGICGLQSLDSRDQGLRIAWSLVKQPNNGKTESVLIPTVRGYNLEETK